MTLRKKFKNFNIGAGQLWFVLLKTKILKILNVHLQEDKSQLSVLSLSQTEKTKVYFELNNKIFQKIQISSWTFLF